MSSPPAVLSVHALDPLGEEGVLPDAGVCFELQCHPLTVVTGVLAARGSSGGSFSAMPSELVGRQLDAALSSVRPAVVRVGLLHGADQVERVAAAAATRVVLAPMVRFGGESLLDPATRAALRERLYPRAAPLLVRAGELEALSGEPCGELDEIRRATSVLREQGAPSVLVSGIVRRGRVLDLLDDEGNVDIFDASRVSAPRIPGLAAAHAAALCCQLALGRTLPRAVDAAQRYIALRLQRGR